MAASVNKVILIGNVGQAPSFKDHGNGFSTATFSLATTKSWRDRDSQERRERTDWHRIEVTGRLAEIVRDIVGQGNQVYVEGELNTDRVERKAEPGTFDYFTKVRAESIQKLGKREREDQGGTTGGAGPDDGEVDGEVDHDAQALGSDSDAASDAEPVAAPAAAAHPVATPSPAPAPAPAPAGATGAVRTGPVVRSWKDRKKS